MDLDVPRTFSIDACLRGILNSIAAHQYSTGSTPRKVRWQLKQDPTFDSLKEPYYYTVAVRIYDSRTLAGSLTHETLLYFSGLWPHIQASNHAAIQLRFFRNHHCRW